MQFHTAGAPEPVPPAQPAAKLAPQSTAPSTAPSVRPADIMPIFAKRCQPCHYSGGSMYTKLPFDDPRTIRNLGERLFTRIKDSEEQRLIRAFLADSTATHPAAARS